MNEPVRTPVLLAILDGFGLAAPCETNAVSLANTPFLDEILESYPWTTLSASGLSVGLPAGQMGNSEVGHLNIGAGRVVFQELTRIDLAIEDGSLESNEVLRGAFDAAAAAGGAVHFLGLVSDGGVHSHISHFKALFDMAARHGVRDLLLHAFLDGRDVPPSSGVRYLEDVEEFIRERNREAVVSGRVATVMGRYFAMDRDNRWDRVERAYRAIVSPDVSTESSSVKAVGSSYASGVTDEFVEPIVLDGRGFRSGDVAVFFNFRPDRARELSRALTDATFEEFNRGDAPDVPLVTLTEYDPTLDAQVAFPKELPEHVLADVLAEHGLRQLHIAETEKYAHVTFFFNGGDERPKVGEERVLIPSPKVATYDLQPEMSAPEVAATLSQAIRDDRADVYIVNFANCDMVGHTGVVAAAVAAVEAVDAALHEVVEAISEKGGFSLITADHGNAECMLDEDGTTPFTAHTLSPVPLILVDVSASPGLVLREDGKLADIAPTLLELMGIETPSEWTGQSLLA